MEIKKPNLLEGLYQKRDNFVLYDIYLAQHSETLEWLVVKQEHQKTEQNKFNFSINSIFEIKSKFKYLNSNNKKLLTKIIYQHFKGNFYEYLGIAKQFFIYNKNYSNSKNTSKDYVEEYVFYRAQYGKKGLWLRPKNNFYGYKEKDGQKIKRFRKIKK